jgi:hypothetical protein
VTVGEIVAGILRAVDGGNVERTLSEIALFGAHRDTGDSDPSRETIMRYATAPGRQCNWRFAALILDFLQGQAKVVNQAARREVEANCMAVLRAPRTRQARFERPPGSDPASVSGLQHAVGAYVI